MHPRISLHQVAFAGEPTALFLDHCRAIGVGSVTLATPLLDRPGELEAALEAALEARDLQVACLNHPFAVRKPGRHALDASRHVAAVGPCITRGRAPNGPWEYQRRRGPFGAGDLAPQ